MFDLLTLIMNLSTLVFVVTSMLAMGLSLTLAEIGAPLRNARLVIAALAANFVLAPLVAYLIIAIFPLGDGLKIGLILVSTAAGAPFLPRLAQIAKANLAFSVGLMVLLMVVTIAYMPLVLPWLIQGVSVNPWSIARPLILLMLIPLASGLLVRTGYRNRQLCRSGRCDCDGAGVGSGRFVILVNCSELITEKVWKSHYLTENTAV